MLILHLDKVPIFEQLQIEEALLRIDHRNWCLINSSSTPAIVMGISGKPEQLLRLDLIEKDKITVIKRYSGGGTVYIDEQTLFVTFICNSPQMEVHPYPTSIMEWSYSVYQNLFKDNDFALRENDFVFGDLKFGGNAQYIQKQRWVHHTSFLWDFDPKKMEYLLLPQRRPQYRQDRAHHDFLCALKSKYPDKEKIVNSLKKNLVQKFNAQEVKFSSLESILSLPHRQSTIKIL